MSNTIQALPQKEPTQRRAGRWPRRGPGATGGATVTGRGQATLPAKIAVVIICFLWIVPVVGLVVTSLRTSDAANSSGWWTVFGSLGNLTVQNYHDVVTQAALGTSFVNSLAITLPATFIPILIAAFAAYAFTFMQFPGRDVLFVLIVGLLVVPNYVAFVPLLKIYSSLHMTGTFPAVWLAHIGFGMSLAIFILRNYMATLPREVLESAKIDGASHFQTFWRLILPMSVPALASFAIFQFLWVWNDLLVGLVFIGPGENQTIQIAVAQLVGQQAQGWQLVTAGGVLSIILPVVIFLAMQRFFIRGLTAGSVKG
jgi:alpha-glucoside transport system permease protein